LRDLPWLEGSLATFAAACKTGPARPFGEALNVAGTRVSARAALEPA